MALVPKTTAALACALAVFAPLARAMQPGAAAPKPAPMRPLIWGELNVLHTTDTHGWHAGHLQESQYSADWGDYVSFAHHLRQRADEQGVDLLLVDTGDRVEGNGLYDSSQPKGDYTYDIFKQQHVDIICTGNHELYQADTADREHERTVPNFHDRYLASNLDYIDPATGQQQAMSPQRYRAFQTKNRKLNVVAFGFLFDFAYNANNTVVQPVRETVREPWFQAAIQNEPADVFIVIGHVGVRMAELRVIYEAIRAANPQTPIALFGGHAHVRDAVRFDDNAFAMASGRYFETIGWMSVQGIGSTAAAASSSPSPPSPPSHATFQRRYMDNNLLGMYYHSGRDETNFSTEHGRNVSAFIAQARTSLKLDTLYGCAPQDYWLQRRAHTSQDSVFSLLRKRVLPEAVVRADRAHVPRLLLLNTGAIRFDIFEGAFTQDSACIISPFVSRVRYIPNVPYGLARQVLGILNQQDRILADKMGEAYPELDWRQLNVPEQYAMKDMHGAADAADAAHSHPVAWGEENNGNGQKPLDSGGRDKDYPELVTGYTTWDDAGIDGDDAVHLPLPFHLLPNCIEAEVAFPASGEPETVDIVFFDFIEKFILMALEVAGREGAGDDKKYTEADAHSYVPQPFSDLFVDWIKDNWDQQC